MSFAKNCFDHSLARSLFEDNALSESGLTDWADLGWDCYDSSLEVHGVPEGDRLTEAGCLVILGEGFDAIYLNHVDGSETMYTKERTAGWRKDNKAGVWAALTA